MTDVRRCLPRTAISACLLKTHHPALYYLEPDGILPPIKPRDDQCIPAEVDVSSGCSTLGPSGYSCDIVAGSELSCQNFVEFDTQGELCDEAQGCWCLQGVCISRDFDGICAQTTQPPPTTCAGANQFDQCIPAAVDIAVGCSTLDKSGYSCDVGLGPELTCMNFLKFETQGNVFSGCQQPDTTPACPDGSDICDDPHMKGLRGQKINWSGMDGGWYNMIKDEDANLHVNVRLTAPMPEGFPDRQLITGLSFLTEGHSLVIEVINPYDTNTVGCPRGMSPCLADGGLRATVDGEEVYGLLRFLRDEYVEDGIPVSASNLPAECRQFGGDKIWARLYDEMQQTARVLALEERFEDWILRFEDMAAHDWCTRYIEQNDLADVQSTHAVFKIVTSAVTVRLNVGTNYQYGVELDWGGRVLPGLEFWQMDVRLHGLSLENESLSGILGETARPVLDEDDREVMEGYAAFRGTAENYRVSGPLGTDFTLLHNV